MADLCAVNWGSIGEWFGGLGAIVAAVVALIVAHRDSRKWRRDARVKRVAFLALISPYCAHAAVTINEAMSELNEMGQEVSGQPDAAVNLKSVSDRIRSIRIDGFHRLSAGFEHLEPEESYRLARAIGGLELIVHGASNLGYTKWSQASKLRDGLAAIYVSLSQTVSVAREMEREAVGVERS